MYYCYDGSWFITLLAFTVVFFFIRKWKKADKEARDKPKNEEWTIVIK
jgi:hypothetical protein